VILRFFIIFGVKVIYIYIYIFSFCIITPFKVIFGVTVMYSISLISHPLSNYENDIHLTTCPQIMVGIYFIHSKDFRKLS
jgi:hypothetical protein